MSTVTPTATGNLGATPLVNLAVYALDHNLTGTLVLEEPGSRKHAVYFASGSPAKVQLFSPLARLGEVLVDKKLLAESEREPSYAAARANQQLHGQGLVASGTIKEAQLREALREQWVRKLIHLDALSADTRFGYFDQQNFLGDWAGTELVRARPLEVIWRLLKERGEPPRMAEVLGRLTDRELRLDPAAPLLRFHFDRAEQVVIDVLRAKPQSYAELLRRDLVDRSRFDRLIYALTITRQFDLGQPGAEPLGVDEAPSSSRIALQGSTPADRIAAHQLSGAIRSYSSGRNRIPPISERPEVRAFKAELRERAQAVDQTFYEVLGVTPNASITEVQAAYVALAKKWHPDRLGPEYQQVRELATRVFARISEAHQVLTDTQRRREYDQERRRAGVEAQEAEQVQRVLRAATLFQKAEVLLKRGNLPEAEEHARQALQEDPEQADHVALVAWLGGQKPEADLKALIKDLDRAIHMQPNNLRAHWYRGQLYKRLSKNARAIQDFRFIVERDPRHTDALRELRLYQMRRTSSSGGSSLPPRNLSLPPGSSESSSDRSKAVGPGLISKFFKR